jgi:hypothetical protein
VKSVNSAPATVTVVLGAVAACIIAFGHLTPASAALVTSLAVALGTLVVLIAGVLNHKPVSMQALTGAVTIIFADLALFGVHMTADERGSLAAATGVVAGVIFHLLHVTVANDPAATAITPRAVSVTGVPGTYSSGHGTMVPPEAS